MFRHFNGGKENPSKQTRFENFLQHQHRLLTLKNSLWATPDAGQICFISTEQSHLKQIVKQVHNKNRLALQ